MTLYATAPVILENRVYECGEELPKSLEDSVVADLKDRELASTTSPPPDPLLSPEPEPEPGEGKLTGEALEAALDERELSKDGTADEKRQRVSEYDAENPPES